VIVGKGLGGSGAVNGMLYVRCTEADMQRWNMSEWSWEDVLGTYKDMEIFCGEGGVADQQNDRYYHASVQSDNDSKTVSAGTSDDDAAADRMHNKYSPADAQHPFKVVTSRPDVVDDISLDFIKSAVVAGVPWTNDFNSDRAGVGLYHFNIRAGVRDSVGRRFLGPLLDPYLPLPEDATLIGASENVYTQSNTGDSARNTRKNNGPVNVKTKRLNSYPNFDLILGAKVTRLLISGETDDAVSDGSGGGGGLARVYGVEYEHHGELKRAFLKPPGLREGQAVADSNVVLSAGALMSPRILMASGVGPRDVLLEANVPVKVHSPQVGAYAYLFKR
jgi:choline dehydrogenase-like flavoprotein